LLARQGQERAAAGLGEINAICQACLDPSVAWHDIATMGHDVVAAQLADQVGPGDVGPHQKERISQAGFAPL